VARCGYSPARPNDDLDQTARPFPCLIRRSGVPANQSSGVRTEKLNADDILDTRISYYAVELDSTFGCRHLGVIGRLDISDVVLETKVLVSRRLEDKK